MCITLILLLNFQTAIFADEYPDGYWAVNTKYEQAINNNDYRGIIEYGKQTIDMMANVPDTPENRNTLIGRYDKVGMAYAELGDYDNSAKTYQAMYDYIKPFTSDPKDLYYDNLVMAPAKIKQYTSEIKMYTDKGTSTNYNAKNEKENGVLFGICSNGFTRERLDNESMILVYQEFGQSLLPYNTEIVKEAANSGCAVEFALNCPNQAFDIYTVYSKEKYLKEISDMFKKYPNVPIYLRFAAEFDIWDAVAEPNSFIAAFRYVSNYFKTRNSNVAIVWSPNKVSGWKIDIDDYYPGDRYVDWVGISLYAQKYFQGNPYEDENNEIAFMSGINSNPVIMVKDIVEKYGNRKPIMLSESGVCHTMMNFGENTTDFALQRLREIYSYLPMVYPQIKLIAYFDWYVSENNEAEDYRLSSNKTLQNEYVELVKGPRFIQDNFNYSTPFCYREVINGTTLDSIFEVSCYAHSYGTETESVTYFIDGKYAGMSNTLPFTTFIDASKYQGTHTLKAIAKFKNGKTLTRESSVILGDTSDDITVEISGREIDFDQEPIIYNERTMVPMRKIFEELGASVSWDQKTLTATGKKGDRKVKVSVGKKTMYVNNKSVALDTAPIILSDRTLVPARAVAEGLGCEVEWDGKYRLVSITPKDFKWSNWTERLPSQIDEDLYYIEEKEEYRYRTRRQEYYTRDYKASWGNFVREDVTYGSWSSWQDSYIYSSNNLEVDTRTISSPKSYLYAHYCTGYISDKDNRYKTSSRWWHDECSYHELGWYNYLLPYSEDSTSDYTLYTNGEKYKCTNSCYRWYIVDTNGGDYTQYRSRPIYREYVYWEWGDWSRWSDWDEDYPGYSYDNSMDIEERTVYRYKEKG